MPSTPMPWGDTSCLWVKVMAHLFITLKYFFCSTRKNCFDYELLSNKDEIILTKIFFSVILTNLNKNGLFFRSLCDENSYQVSIFHHKCDKMQLIAKK